MTSSSVQNPLFYEEKPKLGYVHRLFIFFCAYAAFPLIDVPLIGLSLSAPVFYFIAFESLFKIRGRLPAGITRWFMNAFLIGAGIGGSLIINGLKSGGAHLGNYEILTFVRYCYWLLVFIVSTLVLARKPQLGKQVVDALILMIMLLALVRWYEAVRYGSFGAWTRLYIMTQNEYAWLFSNYAILVLVAFMQYRRKRLYVLSAGLIIYSATLINGSRTGWITLFFGTFLFIAMYVMAFPTKAKVLFRAIFLCFTMVVAGAIFWRFAPAKIREVSISRFITFESLETDKSYQIRALMRQKGLKILKESPLAGCGIGRFRATEADLDLPPILRYASASHFNEKSSHNSYAQFIAETGLLGTIPFAILLISLLFQGFFASIELARVQQLWPMGVYVTLVTTSIHMWSISAITNSGTWLKFGMVAAIIVIARITKRQRVRAQSVFPNTGTGVMER